MKLIANSQLTGEYGTVVAGQHFEVRDDIALALIKNGSARRAEPPGVLYETKVIVPEAPEVRARLPFHHLSLPHEESTAMAPESDRVLPQADLPEPESRIVDPLGRGRRPRSGTDR